MSRFRRSMIGLIVIPFVSIGQLSGAEHLSRRAALSTIKTNELESHVALLADDTLEGREAGTRGGQAAAKYLVQFLSSRSKPAGTRTAFTQFFGQGYQNVVGLIPGSDPELASEFILIGAHYDHVGYGNRQNSNGPVGYIHNGADDNASGTSSLLELVDAFSQLEIAPRRSILFAFWDAEEKGLLGSEHWASNPSVPLRRIRLAINMDMIGRLQNNKLELLGTRSGAGLRRFVSQSNTEEIELDFTWTLDDNSDHHPFFKRRIPVLMMHTGLHSDYHRPSDDAHLINHEGIQRITRLAFNMVFDAANATTLPTYRSQASIENDDRRALFETPIAQPAARLGLSWKMTPVEQADFSEGEEQREEIVVVNVVAASPADQAGIKPGDRIHVMNERPIASSEELRITVLSSPVESVIELSRDGETDVVPVNVTLHGEPFRLGISWRENDAEPGTVTIVRVVQDSPADRAGLVLADRVWRLNGKSFEDSTEFQAIIQQAVEGSSLELEIERRGITSTVNVQLATAAN